MQQVALLAEGVDRNLTCCKFCAMRERSPSSRRAWIEILCGGRHEGCRKRRPPRGGRG